MILKELRQIKATKDRQLFISDKKNRKELIAEKKSMPKSNFHLIKSEDKSIALPLVCKNLASFGLTDKQVLIVLNSVGFFDSHEDVSMPKSWNKTIKDNGNRFSIIKQHDHTVNGIFASNIKSGVADFFIKDLGYNAEGKTQAIYSIIEVNESEKDMQERYEKRQITQHSAGLRYFDLEIASNDENDEDGYKSWLKAINSVINREEVEKNGYFFPIYEQGIIEGSAVWQGSNAYTPAFMNKYESLENEPLKNTQRIEPTNKGNEFLRYLNY